MQNNGTMLLKTKRLRLRKFVKEDINQSFINWASDENVSRYLANYLHKVKSTTERAFI